MAIRHLTLLLRIMVVFNFKPQNYTFIFDYPSIIKKYSQVFFTGKLEEESIANRKYRFVHQN